MKRFFIVLASTVVFVLPADAWYWNKNLVKYENTRIIESPDGIALKRRPTANSRIIDTIPTCRTIRVMGHVETDGLRFYVADQAWSDYQRRRIKPLFVCIIPNQNVKITRIVSGVSLTEYQFERQIATPHGFHVKESPHLGSKTIQFVKNQDFSQGFRAKGYVETFQGRFYISSWSWNRLMAGEKSNWIWVAKEPEEDRYILEEEKEVLSNSLTRVQTDRRSADFSYSPGPHISQAKEAALWEIAGLFIGVKIVDFLSQYSDAETRAAAITTAKKIRNPLIDDALRVLVPEASANSVLNMRVLLVSFVDGNTSLSGITESAVKAHLIKYSKEDDESLGKLVYWTIAVADFLKAYEKANRR